MPNIQQRCVADGPRRQQPQPPIPRLTTEAGTNNYQTSDFWMYSTDRIDLQKVQLSYDFPKAMFMKSFVRGLQLFVNGNSLLTIAKERKTHGDGC